MSSKQQHRANICLGSAAAMAFKLPVCAHLNGHFAWRQVSHGHQLHVVQPVSAPAAIRRATIALHGTVRLVRRGCCCLAGTCCPAGQAVCVLGLSPASARHFQLCCWFLLLDDEMACKQVPLLPGCLRSVSGSS